MGSEPSGIFSPDLTGPETAAPASSPSRPPRLTLVTVGARIAAATEVRMAPDLVAAARWTVLGSPFWWALPPSRVYDRFCLESVVAARHVAGRFSIFEERMIAHARKARKRRCQTAGRPLRRPGVKGGQAARAHAVLSGKRQEVQAGAGCAAGARGGPSRHERRGACRAPSGSRAARGVDAPARCGCSS